MSPNYNEIFKIFQLSFPYHQATLLTWEECFWSKSTSCFLPAQPSLLLQHLAGAQGGDGAFPGLAVCYLGPAHHIFPGTVGKVREADTGSISCGPFFGRRIKMCVGKHLRMHVRLKHSQDSVNRAYRPMTENQRSHVRRHTTEKTDQCRSVCSA